jgi:hypothetical protein
VCARIEETLTRLGFDFVYRKDSYFLLGGVQTYVKFLCWIPVTRRQQLLDLILISKWAKYTHGSARPPTMSRTADRIVGIVELEAREVVSLQTMTGNYVAAGFGCLANTEGKTR